MLLHLENFLASFDLWFTNFANSYPHIIEVFPFLVFFFFLLIFYLYFILVIRRS